MSEPLIDLRSDTVTRPSAPMRRAMAEAEVGDDVFLEDPTVNRLQDRAAEMFGREAGLYVPSGSMGNLACILAQTHPGNEVICESAGHVNNYEMASLSAIAGVLPRVVVAEDGIMSWDQIEEAIRPVAYYRAETALVALENTHNMAGGTIYPTELVDQICARAHERGLRVHLDGARIFNAAIALRENVARMTRGFDSIQFCLSKGLGAPIGSLILGSRELIESCRRFRKMLGGGMRQVGVVAAPGLVALETGPGRLKADHDNARFLADRLSQVHGIEIDPAKVRTNIVIYGVDGAGFDTTEFLSELANRGVLAGPVDQRRVRMVTHVDVAREDVRRAVGVIEQVVKKRMQ